MYTSSPHAYWYEADVTKVYDGDTITLDLKLGFGLVQEGVSFRLWGINAPEVRGVERKEGLLSKAMVTALSLGKPCVVKSYLDKKGKYGRPLGIFYVEHNGEWVCLNEHLVDSRLAVLDTYGHPFTGWPEL